MQQVNDLIEKYFSKLHIPSIILSVLETSKVRMEEKRFFRPNSSSAFRSSGCNTTTIAIAAMLNRFVTIHKIVFILKNTDECIYFWNHCRKYLCVPDNGGAAILCVSCGLQPDGKGAV